MTHLPMPPKASVSPAKPPSSGLRLANEVPSTRLRGRGVFFDERIDLKDPVGAKFTDQVLEMLAAAQAADGKKWRRTYPRYQRVRNILANVMRAHFFRKSPAVLYFAKADAPQYENKPKYIKHGELGKSVQSLIDLGLLTRITGKRMPGSSNTPSWASSYFPTRKLIVLSRRCRVHEGLVEYRLPRDELIQLYEPKEAKYFDRVKGELVQPNRGPPIQFQPTTETEVWTEGLLAINAFYEKHDMSLGASNAELAECVAELNADRDRRGSPYRLPEMFRTQPYRVFNNGNRNSPAFGQGGRLFGGWWMQLPESIRNHITINGQPTIEIDYAECHPRMLYHLRGLEGGGSLYSIPEIAAYEEESGKEPDTYRPCVKWLTQVMINGKGRPEQSDPPADIAFPTDLSVGQITQFIEARHTQIADAFRTGAGLDLMRLESDIAFEIVTTAMNEGWVVLPIHDSFVCQLEHKEKLRTLMTSSYSNRLGKEPAFKDVQAER